ncbi:MAG TPA: 23S rRNA (adenine(2503)-C(2))-methyltransferase RlmN [Pirellulales bacterium]|jgi:23S rRNA (adenine2503-C2)-methyltransferase|nr:23S rRNA (adenine(2503)-C(2))-methyltransferase RlmN [Pirellulales bacterium]
MTHLLEPGGDQIQQWLSERGEPRYRAAQVRHWIFAGRAANWEGMSDLPKPLRQRLAADFQLWTMRVVGHKKTDDGTEKLLVSLADGLQIECVLLRDGTRRTICISTQVGCAMGCVFCASGLEGVARNLTGGEIVEQMLLLDRLLPADERLSHIVVMGMGEPLANLNNLLPALAEASSPSGLGISARRITISTVGLPAAIDRLTGGKCRYNLAVSLHAPDDVLRNRLVKVNKQIGLAEILAAADRYFESSGRRLTFEYVMLGGLNDQPQHARQLASLLEGRTALLNLIPYNPVAGLPYQTPGTAAVSAFADILRTARVNVQLRQRKGDKIDAACGQLRRSKLANVGGESVIRIAEVDISSA